MSYRQFISSDAFEHRISGQVPKLAETLRQISGAADRARFVQIATRIRNRVAALNHDYHCTVFTGGAARDTFVEPEGAIPTQKAVVVYLLIDRENIDSKFITFIHKSLSPPEQTKIFQALYKFDATV